MPQIRKYETRAEQQAAYRKRQARSQQELQAREGLPPLPAIPAIPGHARWNAMIGQAQILLTKAADEMQSYHNDRSEAWQEGARAEDLLTKLEQLQEAAEQLEHIE